MKYATVDATVLVKVHLDIHQGGLSQHTIAQLEERIATAMRETLEESARNRFNGNHFYRVDDATAEVISVRADVYPAQPVSSLYEQFLTKFGVRKAP